MKTGTLTFTQREQDILAELVAVGSSAAWAINDMLGKRISDDRADELIELAEAKFISAITNMHVLPSELDKLYDRLHRSGANSF